MGMGKRKREVGSWAEAMGMSVNGFMKLQGKLDIRKPLRLDQEDENGTTLASIVLSNEKNPEEEASNNAMIGRLRNAKDLLTEREQQVIQWYYYEGITFKDISRRLGVTESRISQIHSNICRQLAKRIAA